VQVTPTSVSTSVSSLTAAAISTSTPSPPAPPQILMGNLASGYDMGVNTSGGLNKWLTMQNGEMCMAYPSEQSWGSVFITVGKPTQPPRPAKDFSRYTQLSLEMRGQAGGESVSIGIKDNSQSDNGTETKVAMSGMTTDWKTFKFPLSQFTGADLSHLYVVTEFVFAGSTPETVCARNIQYLP
jgi:hypothetical protein